MKNFRKDPEVNVFGLIAATKTFLPLVRRGKGIVIISGAVALNLPFLHTTHFIQIQTYD